LKQKTLLIDKFLILNVFCF